MDPNLFHVDWEQLTEVVALVVVLAFFVERALSIVFEHRWFVASFKGRGFKEPIAFALAFAVCWYADLDAVAVAARAEKTGLLGMAITAAVIAGGSKASVKLFQDILGVRSTAEAARKKEIEASAAPQTTAS